MTNANTTFTILDAIDYINNYVDYFWMLLIT